MLAESVRAASNEMLQNVTCTTPYENAVLTFHRRILHALLFLACATAAPLHAMMTPEEYRAARAAASHWIQLRIEATQRPARLPGICLVTGQVTRVFRGTPLPEKRIDLAIDCKRRDQRSPPGDEFRLNYEDLERGRYIEAFVEPRDGHYAVAARQIGRVGKPRAKPTFTGKE